MLASRARQFAGEIMCRLVLAAAAVSMLAAGAASADDAMERRLKAKEAELNARSWRRVEAGSEFVWVEARDAEKLAKPGKGPERLLVIWPDSIEMVPHVGSGVRYTVSQQTFDCSEKAVTRQNWFFAADGHLMAERVPETEDAMTDELLYRAVCEGAAVTLGAEAKGTAGLLAIEPDQGP